MTTAIVLALFLVLATFGFHYAVFRWLSGGMARIAITADRRILGIVFVVLLAHLSEVALYAAAYALSQQVLDLGALTGRAVEVPLDFLYFSIETYTSLGFGDVVPTGHLRFLAGVEALNGLLLIAWSGSFIYLAMGRLWPWERCAEPRRPAQMRRAGKTRTTHLRDDSEPGAARMMVSASPGDVPGATGCDCYGDQPNDETERAHTRER